MEYLYFIIKPVLFGLGIGGAYGSYNNLQSIQNESKARSLALFESEKENTLTHFQYLNLNESVQDKLAPALVAAKKLTEVEFETLKERFDFEGHSALEDAQIILFSETHSSPEIITENFRLLAKMLKPGDAILWESNQHNVGLEHKLISKTLQSNFPNLLNATELNRTINLFSDTANKLNPADWPFKDTLSHGWDLKLQETQDNATLLEVAVDPIVLIFDLLLNKDSHFSNRNSVLEDVFSKLHCKRIFVIGGADHWPSALTKERHPNARFIPEMERILSPYKHTLVSLKDYRQAADKKSDFSKEYSALIGIIPATLCVFICIPLSVPSPQKALAFISRVTVLIYSSGTINEAPALAVLIQGIQMLPDWLHAGAAGLGMAYKLLPAITKALPTTEPVSTAHFDNYCP